jgi:hypothetical protein
MNENVKTGIFAAVAAGIVAVAWLTGPAAPKHDAAAASGHQPLFPQLTDPLAVARLEIVRFDENSRMPVSIAVAQVKDRWCIPSHSYYPADAEKHLAEAVTSLNGLKDLGTAPGLGDAEGDLDRATIRKLHNEYGVIDPDAAKTTDDGVGMRVTMTDKAGRALAKVVIGKEVSGQANQRYVRLADENRVYIVDLDPGKFSTKFEDWIERNLLKLNSMDLKRVEIRDYAFDPGNRRNPLKLNGEMALDYNSAGGDQAWKLAEDLLFDKDKLVPRKMAADEELDTKKIDDLKLALDDLKIVDVDRKPVGLPADLKLTKAHEAAFQSLEDRGFYVVQVGDDAFELLSNKGEIRLQLNDGACYVLRFGAVTGESSPIEKAKAKKDAKKDEKKDEAGPGLNRYLFIMAEFNPDGIAKPAMEPLPEEKKPGDKTPEEKKPAAKTDDTKAAGKKDAAAAKKADAKDAKKNEEKKPAAKEEKKPDLKAERLRIEKDNKRKQEEYDEKVAKGKEHVKELNARFADWYYVISDDVYRKIHLGRDEILKKKEKKDKDQPLGHVHGPDDHDEDDGVKPAPAPVSVPVRDKADAPAGAKQ